ncbi:hypothetical protein Agub_g2123, partial [Astrephomene gubernaculifera]
MDGQNQDVHAKWSPTDVEWDAVNLKAHAANGGDQPVPAINKYYVKGRGATGSGSHSVAHSQCRVPGCTSDLSRDLAYFRKYRICREHLKSPVLMVEGVPSRFCQQCSRFHHIREFDGPQRTCRMMLERLRLKRHSGKAAVGGKGGRGGGGGGSKANADVQQPDTGPRGCSSQSNSSCKEWEPLLGHLGRPLSSLGPNRSSGSGEGAESAVGAAAATMLGTTATPGANSATSTPTCRPLLLQKLSQPQQQQQQQPQQQALCGNALAAASQAQRMPAAAAAAGICVGVEGNGRGNGFTWSNDQDNGGMLQPFLDSTSALLPIRRASAVPAFAGLAGLGLAAAPASGAELDISLLLHRNNPTLQPATNGNALSLLMCGNVAEQRPLQRQPTPGQNAALASSFFQDAPYGLPAGGLGAKPLAPAAATPQLLQQAADGKPPSDDRMVSSNDTIRTEFTVGSWLLQSLSLSKDKAAAEAVEASLGLGSGSLVLGAAGGAPGGGLVGAAANRVMADIRLEMQLRAMYQEMDIDGMAAAAAISLQQQPQQQQQQQLLLLQQAIKHPSLQPLVPASSAGPAAAAAALLQTANNTGLVPATQSATPAPVASATATATTRTKPATVANGHAVVQQHLPVSADLLATPACQDLLPMMRDLGLERATGVGGLAPAADSGALTAAGAAAAAASVAAVAANAAAAAVNAEPLTAEGGCRGVSPEDIDAALEILMEEAGMAAVYTNGFEATLERVCFKLHNVHPRDLPPQLVAALGEWLVEAPAELIQGAIRPGCTQLTLDVYVKRAAGGSSGGDSSGGSSGQVSAVWTTEAAASSLDSSAAATSASSAQSSAAAAERGETVDGGRRVLEGLVPTPEMLARLDATGAEAIVGAEAQAGSSVGGAVASGAAAAATSGGVSGAAGGGSLSNTRLLSALVMASGDVRMAVATYRKLLGPLAVQSMSVAVGYETLTISGPDMGYHVADLRGTVAGMLTPLLLTVAPLAVMAGSPCELRARGAHLTGPGRRPIVRCQGSHVPCAIVNTATPGGAGGGGGAAAMAAMGDAAGSAASAGAGAGAGGAVESMAGGDAKSARCAAGDSAFSSSSLSALAPMMLTATLPGSHRAQALADYTEASVRLTAPEAGLMMLEWEEQRDDGRVAMSEWLPVLSVPDPIMAAEINKLAVAKERAQKGVRSFLVDLGLVLDFATRVSQGLLRRRRVSADGDAAEEEDDEADVEEGGVDVDVEGGDERSRGSRGGGTDQRGPSSNATARTSNTGETGDLSPFSAPASTRSAQQPSRQHDEMFEQHLARVAALVPQLLAYAADGGLVSVLSWLLDFSLEYVFLGDLPALFRSVEALAAPPALAGGAIAGAAGGSMGAAAGAAAAGAAAGLPLLHRVIRSGSAKGVRLLLTRAQSHGLCCNFAQAAGPLRVTPLHLAALHPANTALLHACLSAGPHVQLLWNTVADAAGRTPAVYQRRQAEKAMQSGGMLSAGGLAASSSQHSFSQSGVSSTPVFRSWGSDETSFEGSAGSFASTSAAAAAAAAGGLGAAAAGFQVGWMPSELAASLEGYRSVGARAGSTPVSATAAAAAGANGDDDSSAEDARGAGALESGSPRIADSVEDFQERVMTRRRGVR